LKQSTTVLLLYGGSGRTDILFPTISNNWPLRVILKMNFNKLKAIVYSKYGGPGVLQIKEIEKPSPKDDEVLIKVYAVSINDWDFGLLRGDFINRLLNGLWKPNRKILGSDIAGRIITVGKNVTLFKTGDEVYGDLSSYWGGFAEYACAREKSLALKPAAMSFEEAAAIPQAAMLAVQGLIDKGKIHSGQKILINGAGGGVGTFAVQIARLYGVEITAVDSTSKLDMLRSIGFDHVIDYTKEDFTKNGKCYDLILDVKTNRSMFDYTRALCPNGIYVTVGGSLSRLLQALILAPWISMTSKKQIRIVALQTNKDLLYMNKLFEEGKVKPVIDGPYKLNEFVEAFTLFGSAAHQGKVVITM
jgi:NADPH:quinone reductase-like Zn-dependent oxidoreductase